MSSIAIKPLPFNGNDVPCLLDISPFVDYRGSFARIFCTQQLSTLSFGDIVNVNLSITTEVGTIRGMHFQLPPDSDQKIILCVSGSVYDVIVDIRPNSETYLKHQSICLTESIPSALFIPHGFAHGFQSLRPDSRLVYLHDAFYSSKSSSGLNPLDPTLQIKWPLPITKLSHSDSSRPFVLQ